MADILINGIAVDPLASPAKSLTTGPTTMSSAVAAINLSASETNYVLVQVKRPLQASDRKQLDDAGATILEFVPENTYICRYMPEDINPIRHLPFVLWAGPYLRGFKIASSLSPQNTSKRQTLAVAAAGTPPSQDKSPNTVDVIFHRYANPKAVAEQVAVACGLDPNGVQPDGNKVRVTVQSGRLPNLAALDDVRSIEPVYPVKLHNNIARSILGIDSTSSPINLEGDGQIIGVADTGFDQGSNTNVHPAFTGRVRKLYALGRPNNPSDPDGHGTHVAGSALGDGFSIILNNSHIRGTAPKAELVLQSVLDAQGGLGGLPANLNSLFKIPYQNDGVRIHSNSWGSTRGDGRYDSNASELDEFVWNNRDCVICFSAGNEGIDADNDGIVDQASITPPGTAKNCITVGASENNRPSQSTTYGAWWPNDFPHNPLFSDLVADNPKGMVAFSSRGPASMQRFKPDVVAPGTFILSARSRATNSQGWGLADPNETEYMYEGGTSMATPLVAGCCALIREYLVKIKGIATPSAALIKALLINGATNLPGQYSPSETGPIPNYAEGFGRVDMQNIAGSGESEIIHLQDEGNVLDTGNEDIINIPVPPNSKELKVTLVWTDPNGATLQNDLDLIVHIGSASRHGNMPGNSSNFDRTNNVEQVIWSNLPNGSVRVVVRAYRIAQFPQSYAIAIRAS